MVIVKLIGGLANQMFPYETARRLSLNLNTELKLDLNGFEEYKKREYLAPEKWFQFNKYDTSSLVPETWIRI